MNIHVREISNSIVVRIVAKRENISKSNAYLQSRVFTRIPSQLGAETKNNTISTWIAHWLLPYNFSERYRPTRSAM